MAPLISLCQLLALVVVVRSAPAPAGGEGRPKPNIVLFLTDDQDQMLGASFPRTAPNGATPMPKTRSQMEEKGAMANQFFIHTPICCPSRSELVSGRYYHNIKTTHAPACMHVDETKVNNNTFAKYLSENGGYTVGMFGKYLNIVPSFVPTGFDVWMANGGGNYIAPVSQTSRPAPDPRLDPPRLDGPALLMRGNYRASPPRASIGTTVTTAPSRTGTTSSRTTRATTPRQWSATSPSPSSSGPSRRASRSSRVSAAHRVSAARGAQFGQ
jgi:arylsulfatase A-like enzyme